MEDEKKPYDPNGPITSDIFRNPPALDVKQPQEVPLYPVAGLGTDIPPSAPLEATQPEQQADDLTVRLQKLNESLVGQSSYRAEQEKVQGLPALQQTQNDLTSRLTALKNEALAIPLSLQNEYQGRGATAKGIAPVQQERLRTNAIQALSTNSLLQASIGNITLAMDMVDRAVAQRFDPIKEEIAAKTQNLNLILQSPAYSRADKNRAQAQLEKQQQRQAHIDKAKEDAKVGQAMAAAAVKLYPNDQAALMAANQVLSLDPMDSQYLQKAFGLLGQFQADPVQLQKDLDAHLLAQGNLEKIKQDLRLAPLEEKRLEAQIKQIENDIDLAPLQKEAMRANIAQSWASVKAANANIRKIDADIAASKPINVNAVTDPNAPADVKNSGVLTALMANPKLQGATRTQIGNILGVLNAADNLAKERQGGQFKGVSPFNAALNFKVPFTNIGIPGRQAIKSKEGIENEGYIEAINLQTQMWASGAALTDAQTEQVNKFVPTVNDTDVAVRTKLNNLVNYMYKQAQTRLQAEGITYEPVKVNLFESLDLLNQASPEQKEQLKQAGLIQ